MRYPTINKTLLLTLSIIFVLNIYAHADFLAKFSLTSTSGLTYRIVTDQSVFNDYKGQLLATGKADDTGNFTANLKIDKEGEVYLFVGNQFYKLWMGSQGTFHMSGEQNSLKFTGDYANENQLLYLSGYLQPSAVPGYFAYAKTQAADHANMLDALEQKRAALLKAYQSRISPAFFIYVEQETQHFGIYRKSQFALAHGLKAAELPAGYYHFWDDLQLLADDTQSKSYLGGIGDYTEFLVRLRNQNGQPDRPALIAQQFKLIDSLLYQRPATSERIKGELILFYIKYIDEKEMITTLKTNYEKAYPNSPYTKLIATNWAIKNSRQPIRPSFSLKNPEGETVSIESFRGKIVYIDFWGSWCKACLMEMPSAKLLREKFKERDIVFLYLDFFDTRELWTKAISTHQITGTNLRAEPTDEPYFDQIFGINTGFPRYAVLDKNGLLRSTSAPSPGSREIRDYLEKLLDK